MKIFVIIALLLSLALIGISFASDTGKMETDGRGQIVQGAAPRGDKTVNLNGTSYTTNGSGIWWAVYCTTDAKARLMSTSDKGVYKQFTVPATTWTGYVINKGTPFVNISGCTGDMIGQ